MMTRISLIARAPVWLALPLLVLSLSAAASAARAQIDPQQAYRCERAYGDRDFASARTLCRPLAEAGLADAQFILGRMYQNGEGVSRDPLRAAEWYRRAAMQGHADARFDLGMMYRYGIGVARDPVEAYAWFDLAERAGHGEAARARELTAQRMSAAQIANARSLARARLAEASAAASSQPPSQATPKWTPPPGPALVADVQRGLARLGYDPGPADGVVGAKTRRAIRRFQTRAGLAADGKVSVALKAAIDREINRRAAAGGASASSSSAAASASGAVSGSGSALGAAAGANDARTQALVDALREAVDRAARERSASPALIATLRDLVRRYDWPWRITVFDDDFADGELARNPAWRVVSGDFRVFPGRGMRTRFVPPAPLGARSGGAAPAGREAREDPAAQILGAILGGIVAGARRDDGGGAAPPPAARAAEIHVPAALSNAFAVVLDVTVLDTVRDGALRFGPYRETGRAAGYRLELTPGARSTVELLRVAPGRSAVIERRVLGSRLDDGRRHRIEWRRGRDGEMVVLIDGVEALRTVDRRFADRFAGFVLVNRGGDYLIGRIALFGADG